MRREFSSAWLIEFFLAFCFSTLINISLVSQQLRELVKHMEDISYTGSPNLSVPQFLYQKSGVSTSPSQSSCERPRRQHPLSRWPVPGLGLGLS